MYAWCERLIVDYLTWWKVQVDVNPANQNAVCYM